MSFYNYNLARALSECFVEFSDNIALRFDDQNYTFREIVNMAVHWAEFFVSLDIRTNDTLAIKTDKSANAYSVVLACNILGVAYAHLDPNSPVEREKYVTETLDPQWMIDLAANVCVSLHTRNKRDLPDQSVAANYGSSEILEKINFLSQTTNGDTTAYVMFTSGSTGRPKGVAISHSSLLNFINWVATTYSVDQNDRFAGLNQSHFDNSVFDLYGSLYNGASLIPVTTEQLKFPSKVLKKLSSHRSTIWFSVPSYLVYCMKLKSIRADTISSFRAIIFGGEGFPKSTLNKLFVSKPNYTKLFNVYGPTEATCICSSYEITQSDFTDLQSLAPLGALAPNFDYNIINKDEEGVGELQLLGPQIAQGYLNNPDMTKKKFSFINERGLYQKSYLTGDLVKLSCGILHFKGRVDNQIKHMGYRIELEEIESYFQSADEITECAAVHIQSDDNYSRIELHIVCDGNAPQKENSVKSIIQRLPGYMQPSQVHFHSELPKNANGKIDRLALRNEN